MSGRVIKRLEKNLKHSKIFNGLKKNNHREIRKHFKLNEKQKRQYIKVCGWPLK